jgi:hypothetical protein
MTHFYFNVLNGNGLVEDPEGQDLPDLEAARNEAVASVRSILRDEIGSGSLDLAGEIQIKDAHGAMVLVLPFQQAVRLHLPEAPAP